MDMWEITGTVIGVFTFLVWAPCLALWIRNGVSIPKYVHIVAVGLTCLAMSCLFGLIVAGMADLNLSFALLSLPPALTYLGWFWMFGPEYANDCNRG